MGEKRQVIESIERFCAGLEMWSLWLRSGGLKECTSGMYKDKGRILTAWLDGNKKACEAKSLELRDAKIKCLNRE